MKFVTREVPRTFVEVGAEEFSYSTLYEVLDGLECTDTFSTIVIYDSAISDLLVGSGVANKNIRGSCYRGEKFEEFCTELDNALEAFRNEQ